MRIDASSYPGWENHQLVLDLDDGQGLRGFIALHNTHLGPALGGTRILPYHSRDAALIDALRLSRTMTLKCAVSGLPFGGGKGVIIADPSSGDTRHLLRLYAKAVDRLGGRFYTGEDVGISEADVQYMLTVSPYFIGKSGQAGDPSTYAAQSTFSCIQVALEKVFGSPAITGRSFSIKGSGKTGSELTRLIAGAGGRVWVSDLVAARAEPMAAKYDHVIAVANNQSQLLPVDVYCPCALSDDITTASVLTLKAKIICGTANNQLESLAVADMLHKIGILHIPDFISNAGGLINVADELLPGGYSKSRVQAGIAGLQSTLRSVIERAQQAKLAPERVAFEVAQARLSEPVPTPVAVAPSKKDRV